MARNRLFVHGMIGIDLSKVTSIRPDRFEDQTIVTFVAGNYVTVDTATGKKLLEEWQEYVRSNPLLEAAEHGKALNQ